MARRGGVPAGHRVLRLCRILRATRHDCGDCAPCLCGMEIPGLQDSASAASLPMARRTSGSCLAYYFRCSRHYQNRLCLLLAGKRAKANSGFRRKNVLGMGHADVAREIPRHEKLGHDRHLRAFHQDLRQQSDCGRVAELHTPVHYCIPAVSFRTEALWEQGGAFQRLHFPSFAFYRIPELQGADRVPLLPTAGGHVAHPVRMDSQPQAMRHRAAAGGWR